MTQLGSEHVQGFTVAVTLPGSPPELIMVRGRTARLIAWLVLERHRIEAMSIGQVLFHIGAGGLTPELREHFPRQPLNPET